jgi:hypothetical protein
MENKIDNRVVVMMKIMSLFTSIKSVQYGIPDHFGPLIGGLRFEVVSLLLVSHCEYLPLDSHGSLLLQTDLPLLLPSLSAVVHQLRSRVQDQHPLLEITEERLLTHHARQNHLLLRLLS